MTSTFFPNEPIGSRVIRGAEVSSISAVGEILARKHSKHQAIGQKKIPNRPFLPIGALQLPTYLEDLGFLAVGSPGSGKTQTILQLIQALSKRQDYRAVILDRNGEILEKIYDPSKHIIFNPRDIRSVYWSHRTEKAPPEMIAQGIIPNEQRDQFWSNAARVLLAGIYRVAKTNARVKQLLVSSPKWLAENLPEPACQLFHADVTGGAILTIANTYTGFYKDLDDSGTPFSFYEWARGNDRRWLIIPLFEKEVDNFKQLFTMGIEQVIRGLLSNEDRSVKTAVVIDELGALHPLPSLMRLLAESRKFKAAFLGGTQSVSQVAMVYGWEGADILLQNVRTKLILNSPDYRSAEVLSRCLGMQERIETLRTWNDGKVIHSEHLMERYAVFPSELQTLPMLTGYLNISDGTPITMIEIIPRFYPALSPRFIAKPQMSKASLTEKLLDYES